MTDYVEKGDIILLEKGMIVQYPFTPIRMYKNQNAYSKQLTDGHWTVGEERHALSTEQPVQDFMAKSIRFLFAFQEIDLDQEILRRFLKHQVPNLPSTKILIPPGQYRVVEVRFKNTERKVFCETYNPAPNQKIFQLYFYQDSNYISNNNRVKIVESAR